MKKPTKRCRHVFGEWRGENEADMHQICTKCGRHRFRGERCVYTGREWLPKKKRR